MASIILLDASWAPGDVIIFITLFSTIAFLVWTVFSTIRGARIARIQADIQGKLLDKFTSGQELTNLLQTEQGKKLLDSLAVTEQVKPYGRILAAAQVGVILALAGAALLLLRKYVSGAYETLLVVGALALAMGIGFIVSAAISYRLSKSLGLLNGNSGPKQ